MDFLELVVCSGLCNRNFPALGNRDELGVAPVTDSELHHRLLLMKIVGEWSRLTKQFRCRTMQFVT